MTNIKKIGYKIMKLILIIVKHPLLFLSYVFEALKYIKKSKISLINFRFSPYLEDKTEKLSFDPHYTYHTAWAARCIAKINPKKHVDISSHRFFATLVSAFVPLEYYEYRPVELNLSGLVSKPGDILALPFENESIYSLSCMHVIEHLGLGRYGDPIDPEADRKAAKELVRVLRKGGDLLVVSPLGKNYCVKFNNQRIYTYDYFIKMFDDLQLVEFSLLPDDYHNGMIENAPPQLAYQQEYGCGCFWFRKKI